LRDQNLLYLFSENERTIILAIIMVGERVGLPGTYFMRGPGGSMPPKQLVMYFLAPPTPSKEGESHFVNINSPKPPIKMGWVYSTVEVI
jgi:hypothetical protein